MADADLDLEFAYVNDLVDDYVESKFDTIMRGFMLRQFEPHLPSGRALQMGCFNGDLTAHLEKYYDDITVVDAAQRFLDATRNRLTKPARFHRSLFETFETDDRFDAIFIVHVLEHLLDPTQVLARAKNLMTGNGKSFLVVPNGNAASRQIAVRMGLIEKCESLTEADIRHGHRRVYFLDTLEADVKAAGLTVIQSGGIFFKPLANFQFDALIGGDLITDEFVEGCYQLGMKYPDLCASIYVIAAR